ncbi:MAG: hypothetical protein WCI57_05365 [Candidatus Berkelbacteria bacterium]
MNASLLENLNYLLGVFERKYRSAKTFQNLCIIEALKMLTTEGTIEEFQLISLCQTDEDVITFQKSMQFLKNYVDKAGTLISDPNGIYCKLLVLEENAREYVLLA